MNFLHVYLFFCANFAAAEVTYYSRCYDESSICLLTSIDDSPTIYDDKSKLNRSSAEEWCRVNSLKLAIITDEMVESAMKKFINEDSAKLESDVIFINGRRFTENNWTWINGKPAAVYPSSIYDTYLYVYIALSPDRKTYSLAGGFSTYNRKFICSYLKHISEHSCSEGYQQQGGTCYKIQSKSTTWFDARNICLKEGRDLAIFEDDFPSLVLERNGQYWIGQRKESWNWWNGQENVDVKYSNWNYGYPLSSQGDCLCLKATNSKWTNCDCSKNYRYVCIQEMTTAVTTNTTPTSSSAPTTTPHSTLSVGDSTFQFHSTSTQMLDNNLSDEASGNPLHMQKPEHFAMLLGLGVGSVCLLIITIIIVVVVCIKNRRSRSGDIEPTHGNSPPPMSPYKDDAPNTVYALVVPNDGEPVRSPSEKTPNQTVYAELDLEPRGKIIRRASQPVRYPSERTPDQSVYAEVDLLPKRRTLGRAAVGQQESEVYANSLQVDSVYANNAQTKV